MLSITPGVPSAGQYPGVTSNTAANAGNIGEIVINVAASAAATVTMTIASPCVVTWTGWTAAFDTDTQATGGATALTGSPVTFTNSGGALPTGITSGTPYYVIPIDANTFNVATTPANAFSSTKVNTSGSQSGTHTGTNSVTLTNAAVFNVGAIQLTAGEWDVSGVVAFAVGTTTTINYAIAGTGTTSATFGGMGTFLQYGFPASYIVPAAGGSALYFPSPVRRFSLSATTVVYLFADMSFAVSTATGYGQIRATRVH